MIYYRTGEKALDTSNNRRYIQNNTRFAYNVDSNIFVAVGDVDIARSLDGMYGHRSIQNNQESDRSRLW